MGYFLDLAKANQSKLRRRTAKDREAAERGSMVELVERGFTIELVSVSSTEVFLVRVDELPPVGTLVHIKSENRGVRIWRVELIRLVVEESGFGEYAVMVREIMEDPVRLMDLFARPEHLEGGDSK